MIDRTLIGALIVMAVGFGLVIVGKVLDASGTEIEHIGHPDIIDGDTLYIGRQKIRLYGIDAPERGQQCEAKRPYPGVMDCGYFSGLALARFIAAKIVTCRQIDKDRYGRVVAMCVTEDGRDLSAEMVRNGLAMAQRYRKGPERPEDVVLSGLEQRAIIEKYGLWQYSFERPEEWRRRHKRPQR